MWLEPGFAKQHKEGSTYTFNRQKRAFDSSEVLNNELYRLTFHSHLQALLKYEDRNSMAFSVEGRLPFLDYRLVELSFSLPSRLKIRDGYTKRVLRESMEGILPKKVQWRVSKLGFATPERAWQGTILRPMIDQALRDPRMSSFILPDRARNYLGIIEKSGQTDFMPWLWVNLSLWMKTYELEP
jgi:asparagine synthase (glutamine-hydrolysing)